MRRPVIQRPGPGQESVWDYPRPPALEPVKRRVRVVFAGLTVADSVRALRVLETSHPPSYYIPPGDVRAECLLPAGGGSFCEWKGRARYFDLQVGEAVARGAAWAYPDPTPRFRALRDYLAFYAQRVDACYLDDEQVQPQPGGFYGGWVSSDLSGPFKGEPGTGGW